MFHARASQEYELLDQSQLRRLESNFAEILAKTWRQQLCFAPQGLIL